MITHEEMLKEIASLPPEGQRQVVDFIAFMRQRYGRPAFPEKPTSDLRSEAFIGMWQDRDDLKDSRAWVRQMRQSEWTR